MGAKRTPMEHGLPPGVRARVFEYLDMYGNTMQAGDRVRIDGDLDGRFELKYVDIMDRDFDMAVAWLYGGPSGHSVWRSPQTDRVYLDTGGRKARSQTSTGGPVEQADTSLAGRRKALKLSRGQLSELAGVGIPAIATLEGGKEPRDKTARGKVHEVIARLEAEAGLEVPPHDELIITDVQGNADELAALGHDPFEEDD